MEELLTAGETAQLLRCSLRTLDRERADGRGCPFVRIGGRIRYRLADIESYLAAHVHGRVVEPAGVRLTHTRTKPSRSPGRATP